MSEWVPVVAAVTAAAVTGTIAFLVARSSQQQQTAQHRDRLAHERELADTARTQARLERAYLHLLDVLNMAQPNVENDAVGKPRPDYGTEEARIAAVWPELDAFGSPLVRGMFQSWRRSRQLYIGTIDSHRGRGDPDRAIVEAIRRDRADALAAATAMREQIARELGSPTEAPPRARGREYPQRRT